MYVKEIKLKFLHQKSSLYNAFMKNNWWSNTEQIKCTYYETTKDGC